MKPTSLSDTNAVSSTMPKIEFGLNCFCIVILAGIVSLIILTSLIPAIDAVVVTAVLLFLNITYLLYRNIFGIILLVLIILTLIFSPILKTDRKSVV